MNPYFRIINLCFIVASILLTSCDKEDDAKPMKNELVAVAGPDKTTEAGIEIELDGSASYDGNEKPFNYAWSIKLKPAGSSVQLVGSTLATTLFTADMPGRYLVQLKIHQGSWSAIDDIAVTVTEDDINEPAAVIISQDINLATTLADIFENSSQPDYIVTTDIEVRSTLTIRPGVIIAFQQNASFQIIDGSINAKGTDEKKIILRGIEPSKGFWKGILLYTNNDGNQFEHVTITDGGSSAFTGIPGKANLTLVGSDIAGGAIKLLSSSFENSGGYGLILHGASYFTGFSKNQFSNNGSAAAKLPPQAISQLDSETTFVNNAFDGVETGGILVGLTGVTWASLNGASYKLTSNLDIETGLTIAPGARFEVSAGVTVRVEQNGYLHAVGDLSNVITFTSAAEGTHWNGIYINSPSTLNKIQFAEVSHAGQTTIPGADQPGNIIVGPGGLVTIENSIISNGLGYGVVTKAVANVNADVTTSNVFHNVDLGKFYPLIVTQPDQPELKGVWLDRWSFNEGATDLANNFYNIATGTWFDGASTPWTMPSAAFGIRIDDNGNFIWTVAEHAPMTGCGAYSAEYFAGTLSLGPNTISFNQSRWRSKFVNPCDETWNVDMEVSPQVVTLPYVINQMTNMYTGELYWELTFTSGDGSTFSFYRK